MLAYTAIQTYRTRRKSAGGRKKWGSVNDDVTAKIVTSLKDIEIDKDFRESFFRKTLDRSILVHAHMHMYTVLFDSDKHGGMLSRIAGRDALSDAAIRLHKMCHVSKCYTSYRYLCKETHIRMLPIIDRILRIVAIASTWICRNLRCIRFRSSFMYCLRRLDGIALPNDSVDWRKLKKRV